MPHPAHVPFRHRQSLFDDHRKPSGDQAPQIVERSPGADEDSIFRLLLHEAFDLGRHDVFIVRIGLQIRGGGVLIAVPSPKIQRHRKAGRAAVVVPLPFKPFEGQKYRSGGRLPIRRGRRGDAGKLRLGFNNGGGKSCAALCISSQTGRHHRQPGLFRRGDALRMGVKKSARFRLKFIQSPIQPVVDGGNLVEQQTSLEQTN